MVRFLGIVAQEYFLFNQVSILKLHSRIMPVATVITIKIASKNGSLLKNKGLNRLETIKPIPNRYKSLFFLSFIF